MQIGKENKRALSSSHYSLLTMLVAYKSSDSNLQKSINEESTIQESKVKTLGRQMFGTFVSWRHLSWHSHSILLSKAIKMQ